MIKAVFFDLDGTVSDTLNSIAYFGNNALKCNGFSEIDAKEYRYFAGNGRVILVHRMLKFLGIDSEENYNKVANKYDEEYEKNPMLHTKTFDGMIKTLKNLKEKGLKLAVLSNKPDNVTQMVIEKMYGGLFDCVYGKKDSILPKPDPQGAKQIAEELGVLTTECVMVGDTDVDILTAKNADMKSIGVLWGFRDENELKSCGADYICKKPTEILDIISKIENE